MTGWSDWQISPCIHVDFLLADLGDTSLTIILRKGAGSDSGVNLEQCRIFICYYIKQSSDNPAFKEKATYWVLPVVFIFLESVVKN